MSSREIQSTEDARRPQEFAEGHPPAFRRLTPEEEWRALGNAFEGMCKAGLALTIGFSVAAMFCRMVEQGKVRLPDLLHQVTRSALDAESCRREKPG